MTRLLGIAVVFASCSSFMTGAGCGGGGTSGVESECGNGIREAGEICDGDDLGGLSCAAIGYSGGALACVEGCVLDTSGCEAPPGCGDGVRTSPEECDGDDLGGQSCEDLGFESGDLDCTDDCRLDSSGCVPATDCGDGVINGEEECDGFDLGGETCESRGHDSGVLECMESCVFDVSGCYTCGNDAIDGPELCDGTDLGDRTCESLGFGGGDLLCTDSCTFDTSGCSRCGDGRIDPGEICDGTVFGGLSCGSFGFPGGTLSCTESCTIDTSGCSVCGNGVQETGEDCDGTDFGYTTCGSFGYTSGLVGLVCRTDCTIDHSDCCGDAVVSVYEECDDGNSTNWDGCNACGISEFLVADSGYPQDPAVAVHSDGSFAMAWRASDSDSSGIWLRLFDVTGSPTTSILQVNQYETRPQTNPGMAMASDGRSVVVWEGAGEDGRINGINARLYSATGSPTSAQILVDWNYYNPSVDMADDGRFVVAWEQPPLEIRAQRFAPDGTRTGSLFEPFDYTGEDVANPEVGMAADGRFVVVYQVMDRDWDDYGIFGQLYDAVGATVGTVFQANTYVDWEQSNPDVGMAADGSFVVVWHSENQDGDSYGIFGQRFDPSGTPVGGEFQVNTSTAGDQTMPSVSVASDGSFIVQWESGSDNVFAQRFLASGARSGPELSVRLQPGRVEHHWISMADDGRVVSAWSSSTPRVYAQRIDATNGFRGVLPW